jgi:hypothetical protein
LKAAAAKGRLASGYPGRLTFASMLTNRRLANVLAGAILIDMAKHRTGRARATRSRSGLTWSRDQWLPPLAMLPERKQRRWPIALGTSAGYQFRGYTLDEKQRPDFTTLLGKIEGEDFPIGRAGRKSMRSWSGHSPRSRSAPNPWRISTSEPQWETKIGGTGWCMS